MKKLLMSSAVALLFPIAAMAATFTNVQFQNGDVTISGQGGNTVQATFHVVVPANQVVEQMETDVTGDNLAPVCMSVGGEQGLQEGTHDVTLSVKLPPNTGTYSLNVKGAGTFGGIRSIDCNDNSVGSATFSSALRVVADSNSSTGSSTTEESRISAIVARILAALGIGGTPAPTASPKCAAIAPYLSAQTGTYSPMGVQLQSALLLDNPNSIPALAAGSSIPMGYRGVQTNAALAVYNSNYHCN